MKPLVSVIGAGVVGLCTALHLQERGARVRLIDRDPPAEGASAGNAGVLGAWSCVPMAVPGIWRDIPRWVLHPDGPVALGFRALPAHAVWLAAFLRSARLADLERRGRALLALNRPVVAGYRHLLEGTGSGHLVRDCAYLFGFRKPGQPDLERPGWRLRRALGAPLRPISGNELREIEPAAAPEYRSAVICGEQGACIDPGGLGKALARRFLAQHGELVRAEVRELVPTPDELRIGTDRGSYPSDRVVVAAGAWSSGLLRGFGLKLPLAAERGYHRMFPDPGVRLTNILSDADYHVAATSMTMGLRLAGTSEFAGLEAPPDYRRSDALERIGLRMFPGLNRAGGTRWMGVRPSFPDSLPVIGTVPGHPRIVLAFGHAHLGLTGAPMTGRLAADLALGRPPEIDLEPYRADRF